MPLTEPTPSEALPEALTDLTPCENCAAALHGPFCAVCGQRHRAERLRLRDLAAELPARFLNLNRGLLHTFIALTKSPGTVPRAYVGGKRARYVSPLAYFLLAATVQLVMLTFSAEPLREVMLAQFEANPAQAAQMTELLGENAAQIYADLYFDLIRQAYTYMALFSMCLPYALLLRLFFGGAGPAYNLAEMLVFSVYTIGHFILITGLFGWLTVRLGVFVHSALATGFVFIYGAIAARRFFGGGFQTVAMASLAMLLAYVVMMVTIVAGFMIALFMHATGAAG